MKILTVDDAKTVRQILRNILEPCGYCVLEAENGRIALDMIQQEPGIHVIFLDWDMPELDGYAFLHLFRQRDPDHKIKVIMLTAANKMVHILDALDAGADEYIMKPFTKEMVMEKLRYISGYDC